MQHNPKYEVSFANYPKDFRSCVVSPTKICLQFLDPEIKLRIHDTEPVSYPKMGPFSARFVPVYTTGTDIKCTAIGCQMPIVEKYQMALLDAYVEYNRKHSKDYAEAYNKEFKDFILQLQAKVNNIVDKITRCK